MKEDEKGMKAPKLEPFDLPFRFTSWDRHKDDHKLIAEAMGMSQGFQEALRFLNQVNKHLQPGHKSIFDGTVRSLRYLVKTKQMDMDSIDDVRLRRLLTKYLDDPLPKDSPSMDPDPYSVQAMSCKAAIPWFWGANGRMDNDEFFKTLMLDDLFAGETEKNRALSMRWQQMVLSQPWSKKALNSAQFFLESLSLSYRFGHPLWHLFSKLQPHINETLLEEIPDFDEKHPTFHAVRYASLIVLYRALVNYSEETVWHKDIQFGTGCGFLLDEVVQHIFTPELEFQDWFLRYFRRELGRRVRLIKIFDEKNVVGWIRGGKRVVLYLPILDNFAFMTEKEARSLEVLVPIFHDQELPIELKDEIAKQIVLNIQKIVSGIRKFDRGYVSIVNGALQMLMIAILEPLARRIKREAPKWIQKKGDLKEWYDDLVEIITQETLYAILEYDASVDSSFFGYIDKMLCLRVITQVRQKMAEVRTTSADEMLDDFSGEEGLWGRLTDGEKVTDRNELSKRIDNCLKTLPQKQRDLIERAVLDKEVLPDTERRMKNRALQKLREEHPELRDFLEDLS